MPVTVKMTCTPSMSTVKPAVKKKSVRFGTALSPEVFDKTLPACTPLRKGGTPARTPTPARGPKLRSALKTPQTSDSPDLDPCSPSMMGASPTLVMLGRKSDAADGEEDDTVDSAFLPFLCLLLKTAAECRLCSVRRLSYAFLFICLFIFLLWEFLFLQIVFLSAEEMDSEAPDAGLTSIIHPLSHRLCKILSG